MPDVIEASSQPQAATPKPSDAKSGNLSVSDVAQRLAHPSTPPTKPSTDQVTASPPSESATPPVPAEASTAAPTEAPSEPAKADDLDADALSTEPSLSPKLQAKIDKRIAKEVRKNTELENENLRLKGLLQQQTQQPPAPPKPSADDPLGHINDVAALVAEQTSTKEVKRWAQAQLIREDLGGGVSVNGQLYTPSALQALVLQADQVLEDQIPARYQYLQGRNQAEQQAYATFEWMKDRTSPEYVMYQQAMSQYPEIARRPNAPLLIATQIEGVKVLQAKLDAAKEKLAETTAPAANPPPTPPASQVAPSAAPGAIREPQGTTAQKKLAAEIERLKQKGNVTQKDVAQALAQRELSNRSRNG